jgi:hypothetical protein
MLFGFSNFGFCQTGDPCQNLFISELIISQITTSQQETNSNFVQSLEIFNPTEKPIDLADYSLILENPDYTSITVSLTGTVESGDVFVISDDESNQSALSVTDLILDDFYMIGISTVKLVHLGKTIEMVGDSGPSTPLSEIEFDRLNDATYLSTLRIGLSIFPGIGIRRDESIRAGQSEFTAKLLFKEWILRSSYELNHLGIHSAACLGNVLIGFFGSDPYNYSHDWLEDINIQSAVSHYMRVGLTEPLPWDINFILEQPFPTWPQWTAGQKRAGANDITLGSAGTVIASSSAVDHEAVVYTTCEDSQEGLELGSLTIEVVIDPNKPNVVSLSTLYGKIFYLIADCPMAGVTMAEKSNLINVFPTILMDESRLTITVSNPNLDVKSAWILNAYGQKEFIDFRLSDSSGYIDSKGFQKGISLLVFNTSHGYVVKKLLKI